MTSPDAPDASTAAAMAGGPSLDELSPDQRAAAEEMASHLAQVQQTVLSAPAHRFITNHAMGLYELAAVHLAQPEPDVAQARLAIDALVGLLDATAGRLDEAEPDLRAALSVLQTLYVRRIDEQG